MKKNARLILLFLTGYPICWIYFLFTQRVLGVIFDYKSVIPFWFIFLPLIYRYRNSRLHEWFVVLGLFFFPNIAAYDHHWNTENSPYTLEVLPFGITIFNVIVKTDEIGIANIVEIFSRLKEWNEPKIALASVLLTPFIYYFIILKLLRKELWVRFISFIK